MFLLIKNFTKNKADKKYLSAIAERTLKIAEYNRTAEISLTIVGEQRMRSLNKKYRNANRVTDVLSFGNETKKAKGVKFVNPPSRISYLGEIFICYPQAEKQAREQGHSTKKEFAILLSHGVLHLLGYDHEKSLDAKIMRRKEKMILDSL